MSTTIRILEDDLLCPLSKEPIRTAVMTVDGLTYEKTSIEAWFAKGHNTSPVTNLPLGSLILIPNFAFQKIIDAYYRDNSSSAPLLECVLGTETRRELAFIVDQTYPNTNIQISQGDTVATRTAIDKQHDFFNTVWITDRGNHLHPYDMHFSFEVGNIESEGGGISFGFSLLSLYELESSMMTCCERFENNYFRLNSFGWIEFPYEESYLSSFSPFNLQTGDIVECAISYPQSYLQVFVNNRLIVQSKNKIIVDKVLFPFVTLSGKIKSIKLQ